MESSKETITALKKQLTSIAIKHFKKVDARTLTILQKNKLFESLGDKINFEEILPVLCDKEHPKRLPALSGPLLFYLEQKEPPKGYTVYLPELFFAKDIEIRKAVYDYFNDLEDKEISFLTIKSRNLLKSLADMILSQDGEKWRDAAVAIYDTLSDDWYNSYAALNQCLQRNFIDGIEEYLTKVIRPSIPSAESVTIGIWEVSEQKNEIIQLIDNFVEGCSDIEVALNQYFFRFGHLPLTEELSVISLIDKWQAKYGKLDNIWTILWNWANSFVIPLPRYHVCGYFISNPHLVPEDNYAKLWHEIIEIIYIPKNEEDDLEWTQAWRMLCEIARHYCCHLETRLPFMHGELISSQAWWLAVHVCKLFNSDKKNVKHLRNQTFLPELASSSRIWQVASPAIKPSSLRFLTLNTNSIFSLSLQAMLGKNLDSLNPGSMNEEDHKKFEHTIGGTILGIFPPKSKDDSDKAYAYEDSVLLTARKWLNYVKEDDKNKEMIDAFIAGIEKVTTSNNFENTIMRFMDSHSGDQVLIAHYLKNLIYTEEIDLDMLWKAVNDSSWREAAFRKAHPQILQLVFDALNEVEARYQDKWAYNLPHYYAFELEKTLDKERKQSLFTCVIYSSLCGNTVSAIQRLLKGETKYDYQEEVVYWRKMLEETYKWAPELVKSRIRPILATLHI